MLYGHGLHNQWGPGVIVPLKLGFVATFFDTYRPLCQHLGFEFYFRCQHLSAQRVFKLTTLNHTFDIATKRYLHTNLTTVQNLVTDMRIDCTTRERDLERIRREDREIAEHAWMKLTMAERIEIHKKKWEDAKKEEHRLRRRMSSGTNSDSETDSPGEADDLPSSTDAPRREEDRVYSSEFGIAFTRNRNHASTSEGHDQRGEERRSSPQKDKYPQSNDNTPSNMDNARPPPYPHRRGSTETTRTLATLPPYQSTATLLPSYESATDLSATLPARRSGDQSNAAQNSAGRAERGVGRFFGSLVGGRGSGRR